MLAKALVSSVSFLLFVLSASAEIQFKKGSPTLQLFRNGSLTGRLDYSRDGRPFTSFTGIPYGKIPERFAEAKPAPSFEGIFNATTPGAKCAQLSFHEGALAPAGSEDCLNLNVFAPMVTSTSTSKGAGGLPVMVYIHGGWFSMESGAEYGPQYFMNEDVILVTPNYRLGALGFLSTGDSVIPGNNGLKDLVLALRWVHDNIKKIGGDPTNVSIFGQNSGGALVHYLMLSPTTEGLFHRAISQSGTALSLWAYDPSPKATAVKYATYLNCSTEAGNPSEITSPEIATCLKGLTLEQLVQGQSYFEPLWPAYCNPISFKPVTEMKDSSSSPFLTESLAALILGNGSSKSIPWIVGITQDEGALDVGILLTGESFIPELDKKWSNITLDVNQIAKYVKPEDRGILTEKLHQFYFGNESISNETLENLTDFYSDAWYVPATREAAIRTAVKDGAGPVYLYQYAHRGPASVLEFYGFNVTDEEVLKKVAHGADMLALFNLEKLNTTGAVQPINFEADEGFSKNFIKLWVSFADTGKPTHSWTNGTSKEEWNPVPKAEANMSRPLRWYKLDDNPGYIEEETHFKERVLFWDQLVKQYFI